MCDVVNYFAISVDLTPSLYVKVEVNYYVVASFHYVTPVEYSFQRTTTSQTSKVYV